MSMNLGDWNKPVVEHKHPEIDPATGLPEGWTRTEQDIRIDEGGDIRIDSANTAVVISLSYLLDEDGDRAGVDMSQPGLILGGDELGIAQIRAQLPRMLMTVARSIAEGETRKIGEATFKIDRRDTGTNQQAEE